MKRPLLICTLLGLCSMSPAMATTAATASVDWSTLTITLYDLDPLDGIAPSFSWTDQSTQVFSFAESEAFDTVADWTSALSAQLNQTFAQADASTLATQSTQVAGSTSLFGNATAERYAGFSISANTLALISVSGSYAVSTDGPEDYAYAYVGLNTWGPGATGVGEQENYSGIGSYLESLGQAPDAQSGIMSVTFANLTNAVMSGEFSASVSAGTTVAAVPEPGSYAMFLAGLGLMGLVARRRS